jgi:hypothetical protein
MNSIRFMHIRNFEGEGTPSTHGGKTVAFVVVGKRLAYAVAECGKNQAFNRKKGRIIAQGRLLCERDTAIAKHIHQVDFEEGSHPYEVILAQLGG